MEDLGRLKPSFRENGTVTPANASKLSDGAGAMLLADREAAEDAGLTPIVELVDYEVVYRTPDEYS